MMTIQPINNEEQLNKIASLLEASYGEEVDLKDEVDYFKEVNPNDWYLAIIENETVGFIRYFPVGTGNLVELELYATNQIIKKNLLSYFVQVWDKYTRTSIRICLQEKEADLIPFMVDLLFEQSKTYQEWHYTDIIKLSETKELTVRLAVDRISEQIIIQNLLEEFGAASPKVLVRNIQDEQITVLVWKDKIVGVCVVSAHEIQREIIQFVIAPMHRRKGFGKIFLEQTMMLYRKTIPKLQFKLRVKKENEAAINLYKSIGFYLVSSEYWLTRTK
ncbi:GNAT family N-acetyltransferase [Aureispira anguillae]|uniref:GNAT family N-acetyltransferase n=1 Tax=Aureispira anguillae TaxID=2864201 RepID=A0A915Y9S3_9BACT|nr:GNAT family N-acetyltransferase [Aureispira anguillae]BDS09329.1 GNAT family N-acetyltransferase [Aureispira anguillae]